VKAVVLAAGLGTRLRPLTDSVPKCLVTVGGTSLLDRWLDELAATGVEEVLVNTHHLADVVRQHVAGRADRSPQVTLTHEPALLGSAGTLRANADFFDGDDMFLAVNADNLTTFRLRRLVEAHRDGGSLATITVFQTPRPTECGIVEVEDGLVTSFEEKPSAPRSTLANAGMYALHPHVLDMVDTGTRPLDIGHHLLPLLVGHARALSIGDAFLADIGTMEALEGARRAWQEGQQ
jgi:mannose-1-phosphate guanylyltransferase